MMHKHFSSAPPHDEISRLQRLYLLALGVIVGMAIIGQTAIQLTLRNDETNSRIVNIAGRQRMVSQKLCKIAAQLAFVEYPPQRQTLQDLQASLVLWKQSHYGLQHGDAALKIPQGKNSDTVQAMFTRIEPTFHLMDSLAQSLCRGSLDTALRQESQAQARLLFAQSDMFLSRMDAIVFQYDEEFRAAIGWLQILEGAIFLVTFSALGFVSVVVFRPAVRHLRQTVLSLEKTNQDLAYSNDILTRQQAVLEDQALELETMNTQAQEMNIEMEQHRSVLQKQMFELETMYRELQEARRSQSEFLANLSHELRTPMSAIIGFTEILLTDFISEAGKPFGERVLHSANILLVMLNDLIDFAYIEAGLFEIHRELQPLEPIIASVSQLMRFDAEAKHLTLTYTISPDVPALMSFDERRFRQILFSLLSNAVKFTEIGGVELRVLFDVNSHTLRFEIQDTGIGIAPDQQERVFKPFVQHDGSSTRKYGGIGVGLALVKRIVTLKGGRMWLESTIGKGTTVVVELPRGAFAPAE